MGLRIGLTQRVAVEGTERRDCLDQAWTRWVGGDGDVPIALSNAVDAPARYLDELALDLLVLTGGNDLCSAPGAAACAPERDRFERAAIAWARRHGVGVLGVCRGMQMLGVEAGLSLVQVEGHVATTHSIVTAQNGLPLSVNSYHRMALVDGPGPLEVVATAADGLPEACRRTDMVAAGVMWHPERPPTGHDAPGPATLLALLRA